MSQNDKEDKNSGVSKKALDKSKRAFSLNLIREDQYEEVWKEIYKNVKE